jgi:alkylated DNA repair dioxygenase AlkB
MLLLMLMCTLISFIYDKVVAAVDFICQISIKIFISPQWLLVFTQKIGKLDLFGGKQPNHVLVNEYQPGEGIMVSQSCISVPQSVFHY